MWKEKLSKNPGVVEIKKRKSMLFNAFIKITGRNSETSKVLKIRRSRRVVLFNW